jgi:hypothetical protein
VEGLFVPSDWGSGEEAASTGEDPCQSTLGRAGDEHELFFFKRKGRYVQKKMKKTPRLHRPYLSPENGKKKFRWVNAYPAICLH